jgi:hypothetical protein
MVVPRQAIGILNYKDASVRRLHVFQRGGGVAQKAARDWFSKQLVESGGHEGLLEA